MIAFPLPQMSAAGIPVAPAMWGCHSCGATLRRSSCCQRACCWRFDDRGNLTPLEHIGTRLDGPADIPANHCATCCPAVVAAPRPIHPPATGRAAA